MYICETTDAEREIIVDAVSGPISNVLLAHRLKRETKLRLLHEQMESIRSARQALRRVLDSPEATQAETLEAARLLIRLSER